MGKDVFTRDTYKRARETHVPEKGPVTKKAEQQARDTGKLNPLVDPSGYGVIRRSLPRFEQLLNKLWLLTVGTPMPIETRVDTTGSMGDNVDTAMEVLVNLLEACTQVLPGYDIQIATGIFGDVVDRFVLCRPQFEMVAEKLVEQLTLMVPDRSGGDSPEDPHYGLFGAAYLTSTYIEKIGLKGYDFTVSDETAHEWLDESTLVRVFGPEVFDKVAENGWQIVKNDLPSIPDMVKDLLKRAHAFFLQVGNHNHTTRFWQSVFGEQRVVVLPSTEVMPQVQAAIIGLTEGTLSLSNVEDFLLRHNMKASDAKAVARSVSNIPIGAQAALPNFGRRPQQGDIFREKTDLWPMDPADLPTGDGADAATGGSGPGWL